MKNLDLSAFFQTKAQANDFSARIATVSEKIYETDFHLEKALMNQFGLKKKDAFMIVLRDHNVDIEKHTELKKFFEDIQKSIKELPVLTLTLAFEPKDQHLKALAEWFVLNIKQQMLFEITVDPHLIAGASISFKGKTLDYSIRPKLDEVMKKVLQTAEDTERDKGDETSRAKETIKASHPRCSLC